MYRFIHALARTTALTGGLALLGIVLMTTASILGRSINKALHSGFFQGELAAISNALLDLGVGEINGNYEILEAGIAFAIFSFLPICQLRGAHATVDVFTSFLPERLNRWIVAFWEMLLTAAIVLLVVQLYGGMERYIGNGQTTLFLQFPVWWAYALSFAAGVVACIVGVYCAATRILEAIRDTVILPTGAGDR